MGIFLPLQLVAGDEGEEGTCAIFNYVESYELRAMGYELSNIKPIAELKQEDILSMDIHQAVDIIIN